MHIYEIYNIITKVNEKIRQFVVKITIFFVNSRVSWWYTKDS